VRDIAHSRALGYPVWASDITPVTGKWRLETVEINGPIQIGGVRVAPGDLVVADDTGVCFIPRDVVLEVLEGAEKRRRPKRHAARRSTTAFRCPIFRARRMGRSRPSGSAAAGSRLAGGAAALPGGEAINALNLLPPSAA